jgi:hypothetical protein
LAKKNTNRLIISDSIVSSCRAFVDQDIDIAFAWAIKVIEQAVGKHLTDNESAYLEEVLKKKRAKDRRKKNK